MNLTDTLRLGVFSDQDIHDLLIEPLKMWAHISDEDQFVRLVVTRVGRQPYLLQHLGRAIFAKVFTREARDVLRVLESFLEDDFVEAFDTPVDEVFFRLRSAAQRYVFLKRCVDAITSGDLVTAVEISDAWVKSTLESCGFDSTFDGRTFLMQGLELAGHVEAVGSSRTRYRIITPIVWGVIAKSETDCDALLAAFRDDIKLETAALMLR
jgi:hypothetical protein